MDGDRSGGGTGEGVEARHVGAACLAAWDTFQQLRYSSGSCVCVTGVPLCYSLFSA